ncbi:STAS domain-containing protein [Planctomicrobium sp. SH527]|uniref:STAS domain-containing protein n=1 Tax=Planctomicrobium sp. SH527 TaxID=3448123 RepID=UPI003F5C6EEF
MTSTTPCELISQKEYVTVVLRPPVLQSSWTEIEEFGTGVRTNLEGRNAPACIIDLSTLTYMGSSIVALMVRIWKVVQARNGKMVVVCSHPTVKEVIHLAALDTVWPLVTDLRAAEKKLGIKIVHSSATSRTDTVPNISIYTHPEFEAASTFGPAGIAPKADDNHGAKDSPPFRILYFTLGAITVLIIVAAILLYVSRH